MFFFSFSFSSRSFGTCSAFRPNYQREKKQSECSRPSGADGSCFGPGCRRSCRRRGSCTGSLYSCKKTTNSVQKTAEKFHVKWDCLGWSQMEKEQQQLWQIALRRCQTEHYASRHGIILNIIFVVLLLLFIGVRRKFSRAGQSLKTNDLNQ